MTHMGASGCFDHVTIVGWISPQSDPWHSSLKRRKWPRRLWKLPRVWPGDREHFDMPHPKHVWPCCGHSSINHTPLSRSSRPGETLVVLTQHHSIPRHLAFDLQGRRQQGSDNFYLQLLWNCFFFLNTPHAMWQLLLITLNQVEYGINKM